MGGNTGLMFLLFDDGFVGLRLLMWVLVGIIRHMFNKTLWCWAGALFDICPV
jgi:hypothetical protein